MQSSIVDVSDIAGRRTVRRFVVSEGVSRALPVGVRIGGFRVQLWTSGCEVVNHPVLDSNASDYREYVRTEARFKIPAGVAWLTAVADDNVLVRWELY